jgi:hypothetical protein
VAAGQPVDDLIATAHTAALAVGDPGAQSLTMATVAQVAAVAAQLSAVQSMARDTSDAVVLRWLAGLRQAVPGDLSAIWMTLSNQWTDDATRAATLRDQVTTIAPMQLTGARSIAGVLTGTAQSADAQAVLAQALATALVVTLSDAARQIADGIPHPVPRSGILGVLVQGFAACGLLGAARSIADSLPDAGQRAWAYGAIGPGDGRRQAARGGAAHDGQGSRRHRREPGPEGVAPRCHRRDRRRRR